MKGRKSRGQDEFMAAAIGDLEWLKQSLRDKDSYTDFDENGLSAIHLASIHGQFLCLKFLIEDLQVDVNLASANGWRPIHLCINNKIGKRSLQTLLYLMHKGANLSVCNEDGFSPVHQAANEGHLICLKQLIESGANFLSLDNRGNRPIDLAKLWGHKECAKLLAIHTWHVDKERVAKERYELKKSEIREILSRMEKQFQISEEKHYTGSQPFYKWLDDAFGVYTKKKTPVHKPEEPKSNRNQIKKNVEEAPKKKLQSPQISNSEVWKVSNPYPQYFQAYPGNLRDLYPRHPYTLEPLYWSTPTDMNTKTPDLVGKLLSEKNQNLIQKVAKESSSSIDRKKPEIKRAPSSNRLMYYCNDSVIDLPKKRVPKNAQFLKSNDSVFCLSNDINSPLFRGALNFPILKEESTCPSTASTELEPYMVRPSDCRIDSELDSPMFTEI